MNNRDEQQREREEPPNSQTKKEEPEEPTPIPAEVPADLGEGIFAIDAHVKAANYLKDFLRQNPSWLNGMGNGMSKGNWEEAVEGHCVKLQRDSMFFELQIPKDTTGLQRWLSKRIAGAASWYKTHQDINRRRGTKPGQSPDAKVKPAAPQVRNLFDLPD